MYKTIAIIGSRDYPDMDAVRAYIEDLNPHNTIIISGGARGVDSVAVEHARKMGIHFAIIPALWDTHGKAAGMFRNRALVEMSDHVVAFWDEKSRGTKNTIDTAKMLSKPVTVFSSWR